MRGNQMQSSSPVPTGTTFTFQIAMDQAGQRLDKFIAAQFSSYSRTFLQGIITNRNVRINGAGCKPSMLLKENDHVEITFAIPKKETLPISKSHDFGIEIIEKHEHFLIINKPAGLTVHQSNTVDKEPTVVDWVTQNFEEIRHVGTIDRPGIVHRLDKDTSGVLIIPRTNYAHAQFGAMFKDRTIHKTYLALVHGHPKAEGTINLPIGRHPVLRHKMTVYKPQSCDSLAKPTNPDVIDRHRQGKAREAVTHYRVLTYFKDMALVEVKPVTGRTHQIRVHFAALGHSLVGDHVYGKKSAFIARHALHAHAIEFVFQDTSFSCNAPLPTDFQSALKNIKAIE